MLRSAGYTSHRIADCLILMGVGGGRPRLRICKQIRFTKPIVCTKRRQCSDCNRGTAGQAPQRISHGYTYIRSCTMVYCSIQKCIQEGELKMKERIYDVRLTKSTSIQIEQQQGIFMSKVFDLAKESGLIGHGIEITWTNAEDRTMSEQELLDEGCGLWYIVLEHTNHRFVNAAEEPFIYDDFDAVEEKAGQVSRMGKTKYKPMMVKDFNLKYKKHMPEAPRGFEELRDSQRAFKRQ